jgi:hypothetical protein
MNTTITSCGPVRFAGPRLDRKFNRLFHQFFKLQKLREQSNPSGPHASSDPALTQQPTNPVPKTDKTNCHATCTAPPTLGADQTDKTNSPASSDPPLPNAGAVPQIDKTNSPTAQTTTGAQRPTSEATPQIDKTNSPVSHTSADPLSPAPEAAPQTDKTNSPATEAAAIAHPESQVPAPRRRRHTLAVIR